MKSPTSHSLSKRSSIERNPIANLDFDARVPVPFSVFPSTYRNDEEQSSSSSSEQDTKTKVTLIGGREDTVDSRYFSATSSAKPARQGTTETYRKETRVFGRDDHDGFAGTSENEVDIEVDLRERR